MGNSKKIVNEGKTDWFFFSLQWNPSKTNTIKALKICYLDHSQFLLCGELWFVVPQYQRQLWTFSLRLFDLFSLWRRGRKKVFEPATHPFPLYHSLSQPTRMFICVLRLFAKIRLLRNMDATNGIDNVNRRKSSSSGTHMDTLWFLFELLGINSIQTCSLLARDWLQRTMFHGTATICFRCFELFCFWFRSSTDRHRIQNHTHTVRQYNRKL